MEKLTSNIASKIALELKLDNDNKDVIAYGIFAIMQILISIVFVIIFGLMFHVVIESLIICFVGSTLRKYSGGAHASTPGNCAAIGTVICVGLAMLFLYLLYPLINLKFILFLGILVFPWLYYLIYKLAPVDSPAKPIRRQEKKVRMKKGSIFILNAYLIITIINVCTYVHLRDKHYLMYSLCLYGGASWQVFTLTKLGHITMNKIDYFFINILKTIKGRELQ